MLDTASVPRRRLLAKLAGRTGPLQSDRPAATLRAGAAAGEQAMERFDVAVVGSFMTDLVARVPHWPRPGESVFASEFGIFRGGKGCNQAIAAARAGARVAMLGRLGGDAYGDDFLHALAEEGIADTGIVRDADAGTGIAVPILDPSGENMIVVAPRANMRLQPEDIAAAGETLRGARVLLLQMEVPIDASLAAAQIVRGASGSVIWNVAPAAMLPDAAFALVDAIVVNEAEAAALADCDTASLDGCARAARVIAARGSTAIVTLGAGGVLYAAGDSVRHLPGHVVPVVDTTGAGDAFCGALAAALARGDSLEEAIAMGNAAGALAVGGMGAARSLPNGAAIAALRRTAAAARWETVHNGVSL
ncbi:MAG TPA: ribokinase [Dehalococcoidia bacterium]|nr:ribokinase [Dehalococcoidia bacterium]